MPRFKKHPSLAAKVVSGRCSPSNICPIRPGPSWATKGSPVMYIGSPILSPDVSS